MKILRFAIVFCFISSSAMEQEFILDEKSIEEFKAVKQELVKIGKIVDKTNSNRILEHFISLTQKNDEQLRTLFTQRQPLIKELYDSVIKKSDYQKSLAEAVISNDGIQWKLWRKINGHLLASLLEEKGVKFPSSSSEFIEANRNLDDEALNYYDASSFLIFYARQNQRAVTGKDLPLIDIK